MPFESWEGSVELVQGNFENVALRHKEAVLGYTSSHFFFALQHVSLSIRTIVVRMVLPFQIFSLCEGVEDACWRIAPLAPIRGCFQVLLHVHADLCDHEFCRTFLACRTGKAAFLENAAMEIAEHIDVVEKRGQPLYRAQVGGPQVPHQVVDIGDIGHEAAAERVFMRHAFERFSHCHCHCSGDVLFTYFRSLVLTSLSSLSNWTK